MDNLTPAQQIINGYLIQTGAKIYGDSFIGYRAQLPDGTYDDDTFGSIYEDLGGVVNSSRFNEDCDILKAGPHNW